MDTASSVAQTRRRQQLLAWLTALNLTSFLYPPQATVTDQQHFDFIIVGGGTAGCALANRLSENTHFRVLLVEAGRDPSLESDVRHKAVLYILKKNEVSGLVSLTPHSRVDWNFTAEAEPGVASLHRRRVLELTRGRVLGGSSAINLMVHVRGAAYEYRAWAAAAGDDRWAWPALLPYFIRSERLLDARLLREPQLRAAHGRRGPVAVTRQQRRDAEPLLRAFAELGHRLVPDVNAGDSRGYTQPMLTIAAGRRWHAAFAYLAPVTNRTNLYVLRGTMATKILFDEQKTAVGLECETENRTRLTLYANREIILSAGALQSPQLLMLSGVGPADHLRQFNIPVVADLPVGENLQDHSTVMLMHRMQASKEPTPAPLPTEYIGTAVLGFVAINKSMEYPDYQSVSFIIPRGSGAAVQMCAVSFGFEASVCDQLGEAARDHVTLLSTHHLLHPRSRGRVLLRSADPLAAPRVQLGLFSDESDLEREALYLADFARVVNTSYFRGLGAQLLELGGCGGLGRDYWRCYARRLASTTWHYSGTCALGRVLDARLRVRGLRRLRVADASVMPTIPGGNTNAPTYMIAELASDFIKQDHS